MIEWAILFGAVSMTLVRIVAKADKRRDEEAGRSWVGGLPVYD